MYGKHPSVFLGSNTVINSNGVAASCGTTVQFVIFLAKELNNCGNEHFLVLRKQFSI